MGVFSGLSQIARQLLLNSTGAPFTTPEDMAPSLPQGGGILSTVNTSPDVSNFRPAQPPGFLDRLTADDPETGTSVWDRLGGVAAAFKDAGNPDSNGANTLANEKVMAAQRQDTEARRRANATAQYVQQQNDPELTAAYSTGGPEGLFKAIEAKQAEARIRSRPEFKTAGGQMGVFANGQFTPQGDIAPTVGERQTAMNEDRNYNETVAQHQWERNKPQYLTLGPDQHAIPIGGAPAMGAPPAAGSMPVAHGGFDSYYADFLAPHEGGYTASDGNGAPANFGINQKANPDVDVRSLTPQAAKQIMHDRYWVPSGADKLPPGLAEIQADTAVNMGVGTAQHLLQQSGGDPQAYLALREQRYRAIAAADPSKASSLPTWLQRNAELGQYAQGFGAQGSPPAAAQASGFPAGTLSGGPPKPEYRNITNTQTGVEQLVQVNAPGGPKVVNVDGVQGAAPVRDPSLTGEAFLKALDPTRAAQVKALAEGRQAFPTGLAMTKPYGQQLAADVAQYDPTFNAQDYNARAKTRADFTSGASSKNLTSINTTIGHLGSLYDAIDGLQNTNFPDWNKLVQSTAPRAGNADMAARIKNFETSKTAVIDEMSRAFKGAGGTVHDIKGWEAQLNATESPQALKAVVSKAVDLLNSRIESVGETYRKGMGNIEDPTVLLSPSAQKTLKKLEGQDAPEAPKGGPKGGVTQVKTPYGMATVRAK